MSQLTAVLRRLKPQATPLQWVVLALMSIADIAGIIAIEVGNTDLGRALTGLGIVALGPFAMWTRQTRERTALANQHHR